MWSRLSWSNFPRSNVVPYLKVLPHFGWVIGALADERIRWITRTSGELPRVEDDAFQVINVGSERKTIRSQLRAARPGLLSAVAQNAGFATNARFSKAQWSYRFKCRTTPADANDRFSKRHESVSCYARSHMIRRMPPFGPLVAFDAVARNRSFTRAADELGVTQSAISHQVRRLEEFFGMQLLIRRNPGVELSDDGARLEGELGPLLNEIAGLGPRLRYRSARQMLRLGAGSSLAGWWLVRRLRAFRHSNSEIEIDFRLVESEAVDEPPLDVRILWTTLAESRATPLQEPLLRERIFPVCAPSLLPRGIPLSDPTALLDLPLIQKGHPPEGEWSWAYWFGKLGLKRTARSFIGGHGPLPDRRCGGGWRGHRPLPPRRRCNQRRAPRARTSECSSCTIKKGSHCALEPGSHWRSTHQSFGKLARASRRRHESRYVKRLAWVVGMYGVARHPLN